MENEMERERKERGKRKSKEAREIKLVCSLEKISKCGLSFLVCKHVRYVTRGGHKRWFLEFLFWPRTQQWTSQPFSQPAQQLQPQKLLLLWSLSSCLEAAWCTCKQQHTHKNMQKTPPQKTKNPTKQKKNKTSAHMHIKTSFQCNLHAGDDQV